MNLALPCAVLTGAWLAVPVLSSLPLSLAGLRTWSAWGLLALAAIIAVSFRRGRIVFALMTLAAAYGVFTLYSLLPVTAATTATWRVVFVALCVFAPLNLALLCVSAERGTFNWHGLQRIAVLAAEIALTALLAFNTGDGFSRWLYALWINTDLFGLTVPHGGLVVLLLAFAACAAAWMARLSCRVLSDSMGLRPGNSQPPSSILP